MSRSLWWLSFGISQSFTSSCVAAAVKAAMWSQRVVGLQGSGSLRLGLSQLSDDRPSLWRCVCRCRYRVLLDWHRLWRGHSQAVLHRWWQWHPAGYSLCLLLLGWHFRVRLLHVVFRGFCVARPPLQEARAFVVLALRCLPGSCFVLAMAAILGAVQVRGSHLAVTSFDITGPGCWCCRRPRRGKNTGLIHLAYH